MRHALYSELRTLYEATADNPRTFRVTMKMKDMIDETVLVNAVRKSMERYPYYRVRLGMDEHEVFFLDNPMPVPVLHTDGPIVLGGFETQGHVLAFCWWKNKVHIDLIHALTDGGGLYHLIQTFLYYYCSEFYGRELSSEGIWLAGDEIAQDEWIDPGRKPLVIDPTMHVTKWNDNAFQIADGGIARVTKKCVVYNIRISESEFMRFNLSNEGSPGTVISLFLARAIAGLHPDAVDPVAIALCVNQRRMIDAPLAHQSLVGDARLVFKDKMKQMSFDRQVTCFRAMVALQTDVDMVRKEVQEYQDLMQILATMPTHEERHAYCKKLSDEKSRMFTATVSYVGKADLGEAAHYVQEFHVLPSTALPSCETPLTLELSAVNGCFYVNFMQYFEGEEYLTAFIKQLRENDINYDVLYAEPTKYPGFISPWL